MNFGGTLRVNKFACFIVVFIIFLIIYFRSGESSPPETTDFVNLKDLLNAAIFVAEHGGKKVLEGKGNLNVKSKGKTQEGANDPVTDADYSSHCVMYYSLKNTFPKLTVISEEHKYNGDGCSNQERINIEYVPPEHRIIDYLQDEHVLIKDVTVWIDPLDATQEYTEGLYKYVTTMVCIAVKGNPVIGVIHYPFSKPQTYWGWLLKHMSGNIAAVLPKEENKAHPRIIVSRSHPGKVSEIAESVFGEATITTAAGAGYKVMEVVNGTQDLYFHSTYIKKWDLCAGNAIINTVSGKMTTTKGEIINYSSGSEVKVTDGILVTRYNHDYYLKKIQKVMEAMP